MKQRLSVILFIAAATLIVTPDSSNAARQPVLNELPAGTLQISVRLIDQSGFLFRIDVINPSGKWFQLNIEDKNTIFQSDFFNEKHFARVYNLNEFEDGDYTIFVRRGKEKIVKKVKLKTERSTMKSCKIE